MIMAKQVSKTVIGGFVISSIALLVLGIVIFGGGKFFEKTVSFVMFFDRSVKGLNVGASVVFRGVKVGTVKAVSIYSDAEKLEVKIPVVLELDQESFQVQGKRLPDDPYEKAKIMIKRGLRGTLATESFVTGKLMIELDWHPEVEPHLVGDDFGYPELPSMASDIDRLGLALKKAPLDQIFARVLSTLDGADNLINSKEIKETLSNLQMATANADSLITGADKFVQHLDDQVDPISGKAQAAINDGRKLLQNSDRRVGQISTDTRKLLTSANTEVVAVSDKVQATLETAKGVLEQVSDKAQDTLGSAKAALVQAEHTLKTYENLVAERSPLRNDLSRTLNEITLAANSIEMFFNYLEQHPEALITGKGSGN
jgi:paraquat-inducible protein B